MPYMRERAPVLTRRLWPGRGAAYEPIQADWRQYVRAGAMDGLTARMGDCEW